MLTSLRLPDEVISLKKTKRFWEDNMRASSKVLAGCSALILTAAFVASSQPSPAEGAAKVIGFWKLVSYVVEVQTTGEKEPVMGSHPSGYVDFSPEGRVMFILTGEGRKPAKTADERAALLGTLVAYTGIYRIEGDHWITKVDVAWNPEWVGTEQARQFKIEGDRLQVLTPWRVMPNWPDKGMQRSIVTFERAK
jgi:Lipocalin-like domain